MNRCDFKSQDSTAESSVVGSLCVKSRDEAAAAADDDDVWVLWNVSVVSC